MEGEGGKDEDLEEILSRSPFAKMAYDDLDHIVSCDLLNAPDRPPNVEARPWTCDVEARCRTDSLALDQIQANSLRRPRPRPVLPRPSDDGSRARRAGRVGPYQDQDLTPESFGHARERALAC